jgi:hypothetical protein
MIDESLFFEKNYKHGKYISSSLIRHVETIIIDTQK